MSGKLREYKPAATRLGSYEIIRPLARGGMAELLLARAIGPEGFEKLVVLKRILPHFAENPQLVRAFLDEAKLVATFDHPHIAHVYDMGTVDGTYFFTMEYVHGVDVRTILKRCWRDTTTLPIALAVLITRNIASALHFAHERHGPDGHCLNVVHRDVSPSNIIVSYDGSPKLIDFGVAKATNSSIKTQTGALKGKIAYMSPEQAKGAQLDRRSDVFALGIVLWEMITCRQLYKGDNDIETLQRIIHEPPPSPCTARAVCPAELERIVMRALAIDPIHRYQTAEEMQLDLEEFAREHKLNQSSIALSRNLHQLFDEEIKAWTESQSSAATVTDALLVPPNAESDTGSLDCLSVPPPDDDDDDDDQGSPIAPPPCLDETTVPRAARFFAPETAPETAPQTALQTGPVPVAEPDSPTGSKRAPVGAVPPRSLPPRAPTTMRVRQDAARPQRTTWIWGGGITLVALIAIAVAVGASGGHAKDRSAEPIGSFSPQPVSDSTRTAVTASDSVDKPAPVEAKPAPVAGHANRAASNRNAAPDERKPAIKAPQQPMEMTATTTKTSVAPTHATVTPRNAPDPPKLVTVRLKKAPDPPKKVPVTPIPKKDPNPKFDPNALFPPP